MMSKKDFQEAVILSIPVFGGTKIQLLKMIENHLKNPSKADIFWINTPNAEQIVQSVHDTTFKKALMGAKVRIPDGMSLVLASRLLPLESGARQRIVERVSGVDVVEDLVRMADSMDKSVFLLGGGMDTAMRSALALKGRYSRVRITADAGSTDICNETNTEREKILREIRAFGADILLVGYGAPQQERWVADNKKALQEMGVSVVMVVGGAFDMLSGRIPRAPGWMRRMGLEWAWRLWQEPWRWRRQLRLFEFWRRVLWS